MGPLVDDEVLNAFAVVGSRHHPETDPASPPADQRQDRTLPPHPGRRLGPSPRVPQRIRPPQGTARLATRVRPPPATHRAQEPPADDPLDQPVRSVHLAVEVQAGTEAPAGTAEDDDAAPGSLGFRERPCSSVTAAMALSRDLHLDRGAVDAGRPRLFRPDPRHRWAAGAWWASLELVMRRVPMPTGTAADPRRLAPSSSSATRSATTGSPLQVLAHRPARMSRRRPPG
jgi:hypothetical protein